MRAERLRFVEAGYLPDVTDEAGNPVPAEWFAAHLLPGDWPGGTEEVTLVFVGRTGELRARIAVISPIASLEPWNIHRHRFRLTIGVSRIQGLSSLDVSLRWGNQVFAPTQLIVDGVGVIETTDSHGQYKEYRSGQLPLGAEEELTDFTITITAVFEGVNLAARAGVAGVRLVDHNGTSHYATTDVVYEP